METIQFSSDRLIYTNRTFEKPVLNIINAVFNSNDSNWTQRLYPISLTLRATCYDKNNISLCTTSQELILGTYITEYQRQPILEINYTKHFDNPFQSDVHRQAYWITEIILKNIEFGKNETINISILDREDIQKKVEDWKNRIDRLYLEIKKWVSSSADYSCNSIHTTVMNEEIMQNFEIPPQQIKTLDITYNGKTILAFKPKGLWTIAANGRIDILSKKGSFMLVDFAEHFQTPNWNIYTADKKTKNIFNETAFNQVLTYIIK